MGYNVLNRMRPHAASAALAAVLGAGAVFALASPAPAAPAPSPKLVAAATGVTAQALSGYQLRNRWAGVCLDNNTVDVYALRCGNDLPNQRWFDDDVSIWSYYSHKCLDGNRAEDVYVLNCYRTLPQSWKFQRVGNSEYFEVVHVETSKCLDTNGTAVYKTNCDLTHRNTHQHWLRWW